MAGGTGVYNVNAANTNRTVRFMIESSVANAFAFLKGSSAFYPHTSQITSPTANQRIAQERADVVVRTANRLAPPTAIKIVNGAQTASALILEFETAQSAYVQAADITDTLGLPNGNAKSKLGLTNLMAYIVANASLDGGGTLLFDANPTLQDGTTSTAAAITTLTVTSVN